MMDRLTFIEGPGLNNPDEAMFDLQETGRTLGADKDPIHRLVLRQGELEYVGATTQAAALPGVDPDNVYFYKLPSGLFLRVVSPYKDSEHCEIVSSLPPEPLLGEWGEGQVDEWNKEPVRQASHLPRRKGGLSRAGGRVPPPRQPRAIRPPRPAHYVLGD